jgi:hypothetical protein
VRSLAFFVCLLLSGCAQTPATSQPAPAAVTRARPSFALRHDSAPERATRTQLDRLFDGYDLTPWLFTRAVLIDDDAIPHSHPLLTLHTRHLRDDLLLLSTFIHEESHWYLTEHQADVDAAVVELRAIAPGLPVGFPDGAQSETSSYEHLLVIALEERGLKRLVGELAAHEAMEFWATDHYRALYRVVLEKRADVWRVMRTHGLSSPGD